MQTYLDVQLQDMQRNGVHFDLNEPAACEENRCDGFVSKQE